MFKKSVLILCFFLLSSVCFANERFKSLPDSVNQLSSFDTKNIKYSYNDQLSLLCIDVWIQTKYLKKDIHGYMQYVKKLNESEEIKNNLIGTYIKKDTNLVHYLMSDKMVCILGFITYDQEGQVIDSFINTKIQWKNIPSGSIGDRWYEIIKIYAVNNNSLLKSRMK